MSPLRSGTLFAAAAAQIYRKRLLRSIPICDSSHRSFSAASGFAMRRLNSATLFPAAAAAEIYRKRLLRSVPICDSSRRYLSAAAGFAMRRLNSATLFPTAAEIYRKQLLRSVPICDSSHRSLSTGGAFGMSRKPYQRKRLPVELSALEHVAELTCESAARSGVCHVYLIGTMHYSRESCKEVKAMIESVKPEAVFLELCPNRAYFLKPENPGLGGEFRVAYEEAIKHGARKVRLGDRPNHITRDRYPIMEDFWDRLVSPLKIIPIIIKMIHQINDFNLAQDEIMRILKHKAINLARDEAKSILPSRYETLVNERDQYMSAKLLEVAQQHNSVVAVVGKGHVPGIQKYWKQPIDVEQLLHVPTRTRMVTRIRDVLLKRILKYR